MLSLLAVIEAIPPYMAGAAARIAVAAIINAVR